MSIKINKSARLRELLRAGQTLVMPDAYDAISARIIEHCGFQAVQCSGCSISISLCQEDEARLTIEQNLEATRRIVSAVEVPVMADGEDGYGGPEATGETIRRFVDAGVAGINIEDQVIGAKGGVRIVDRSLMIEKLQAARQSARSAGNPELLINGRTDALRAMPDRSAGLQEAISRANAYLQAGADLAFVTYAATLDEVKACVSQINGPVSIAAGQAYNIQSFSIEDLQACGVARVSLPTLAILASVQALASAMRDIHETKGFKAFVDNDRLATWAQIREILRRQSPR
jgi:2-methylisocitrate lyase-like PEP mutase family enzyme